MWTILNRFKNVQQSKFQITWSRRNEKGGNQNSSAPRTLIVYGEYIKKQERNMADRKIPLASTKLGHPAKSLAYVRRRTPDQQSCNGVETQRSCGQWKHTYWVCVTRWHVSAPLPCRSRDGPCTHPQNLGGKLWKAQTRLTFSLWCHLTQTLDRWSKFSHGHTDTHTAKNKQWLILDRQHHLAPGA